MTSVQPAELVVISTCGLSCACHITASYKGRFEQALCLHSELSKDVGLVVCIVLVHPKRNLTKVQFLDDDFADLVPSVPVASRLFGRKAGINIRVDDHFEPSSLRHGTRDDLQD